MASDDPAEKLSISMPQSMERWVQSRVDGVDIKSISHYLQKLVSQHMKECKTMEEPGRPYGPEKTKPKGEGSELRPRRRKA